MKPFQDENIWIIGASSGIGWELAKQLAKLGANLILSARSQDKLESLQKEIGGKHAIYSLDVSDYKNVQQVFSKIQKKAKLDRLIFLAAIYQPGKIIALDLQKSQEVIQINLLGAIHCAKVVLPFFKKQILKNKKKVQIALCGSVAGYTGLPLGQPYSATKAAMINFAESLYVETPPEIDIKLISPGFVKTPMTDENNFKMPMIISADKAARFIVKGLEKKAFEIHFPKRFTLLMKSLSILPYGLKLPLIRKWFNKK